VLALLLLPALATARDYREERIPLTLDDGRTVEARLRLPVDAEGPFPVVMLFGGFRTADAVLDLVHTTRPVAWANFDYPFEGPRKFRFPQSLKLAPQMRAAIHGTFDGVGKLHAALKQHPEVDATRITVAGASAGAPFATVGAAKHGIPGAILVQGFGQVTQTIAHQFVRKYEPRWGGWVRRPARWLAAWILWYCDVPVIEDYARQMQPGQKVLLVTALDDDFIPRPSIDALWQALQQSGAHSEHLELPGTHLRSDRHEQIADILQRSVEWLERHDLL
jgi:hypothetical protein